MSKNDGITGGLLLICSVAVIATSLSYPVGTFQNPGAGLFPLLGASILAGLSLLLIFQAYRERVWDTAPFFDDRNAPKRVGIALSALLGFCILLPTIGFAATTFIFVLSLLKLLGGYRWTFSLIFAAVTAVCGYFIFVVWLGVSMPPVRLLAWQG